MVHRHIPVLLDEAVGLLNCSPGKTYADCTLGGGGHAGAILPRILPDGLLIGIDQDRDAIRNAGEVFARNGENIRLFHGNFTQLPEFMSQLNISSLDGILLDLGLSSDQLCRGGRGFGFYADEALDMRMDTDSTTRACDLIEGASEKDLAAIFFRFGEERYSRQIARHIVRERERGPIGTSAQLAQIVARAIPAKARHGRIHPATRVFMALRIAVNKELERLEYFLDHVVGEDRGRILNPDGRLCVISFHSLEDRIVKQRMKTFARDCECPADFPVCVCGGEKQFMRIITKKAVRPSAHEIAVNALSRSAKLRVAEKLCKDGKHEDTTADR